MRILVTGGCGFIASHLVNYLVDTYPSYTIVNLDKLDECSSLANVKPSEGRSNYKFVRGDLLCDDLVRYVLESERIDTIIHAAAHTHVDNSFGNSLKFTMNNVYGTHVLLEVARDVGTIQRFIHVSTDEVYGSCEGERKTEQSLLNPTNPYSASKAAAENVARGYWNSFQFPIIITRGNNVYGPNQYPEKMIPKFILRLLRDKPCCIHGDGSNLRHFVHVEDVVRAFDLILHKGRVGETYNIGTSDEFTTAEVARRLVALLKPDDSEAATWIEHVEDRAFNDVRYFLNYDKLTTELGWSPRVPFARGLAEVVEWYRNVDAAEHWRTSSLEGCLQAHPGKSTSHIKL